MHLPAAGPRVASTTKSTPTRNPNSISVQVRLFVYWSVVCFPMGFPDGPMNRRCYLFPLFLFQAITTTWANQWEGFFHMLECTWLKGCGGKTYVGADDLALKLVSDLSQSTALFPRIALFHSWGLFSDAWHFLVALTALLKDRFRPTPWLFCRPSWLLSERVSLRVNCNIFDKFLSLPPHTDCF